MAAVSRKGVYGRVAEDKAEKACLATYECGDIHTLKIPTSALFSSFVVLCAVGALSVLQYGQIQQHKLE